MAGVVSVIALLQADPAETVAALMDSDPVRVTADADLTDIALLMADYNLYTIPVVDDDDRVLGVVTVDDVLEATIPEDWRRREPAPRPVRDTTETPPPMSRCNHPRRRRPAMTASDDDILRSDAEPQAPARPAEPQAPARPPSHRRPPAPRIRRPAHRGARQRASGRHRGRVRPDQRQRPRPSPLDEDPAC